VRAYPSVSLEIVCSDFVPYSMEAGIDLVELFKAPPWVKACAADGDRRP